MQYCSKMKNKPRKRDSEFKKAWLQSIWWFHTLENDQSTWQLEYRRPWKGYGQKAGGNGSN